jgi:hypothetical protein
VIKCVSQFSAYMVDTGQLCPFSTDRSKQVERLSDRTFSNGPSSMSCPLCSADLISVTQSFVLMIVALISSFSGESGTRDMIHANEGGVKLLRWQGSPHLLDLRHPGIKMFSFPSPLSVRNLQSVCCGTAGSMLVGEGD